MKNGLKGLIINKKASTQQGVYPMWGISRYTSSFARLGRPYRGIRTLTPNSPTGHTPSRCGQF